MYAQLCVKRSATFLPEPVFQFARQWPGRRLGERGLGMRARIRSVPRAGILKLITGRWPNLVPLTPSYVHSLRG